MRRPIGRFAVVTAASLLTCAAYAQDESRSILFDVPELTVESAINVVAEQSGSPAIFPYDQVKSFRARSLRGYYTLEDALALILADTGLTAQITNEGVITVVPPNQDLPIGEIPVKLTTSKSLLLSSAAAVSAVVAPIQVSAQTSETQSQSRYAIDEIVVTSRRVEEGLQSAPLAVTAISGVELENRGALDVIDFADVAPNVSMKTNGSVSGFAAAPRTSIRGIGQADFVINTDPAVGLYADGVYLGRSIGSVLDLVDVERVEALRGPQGTLFGRNSTGGAINVITKKPEVGGTLNGYATAAIGEGGYYLLRGSANIPVGDNTAIRVSGLKRERDGFIPLLNPNPIYDGIELGRQDVQGVKAALRWEPTDNLTLDLDADYSERNDGAAPIIAVHLGDLSIGESGLDANRPRATTGQSTAIHARRFNGEGAQGPNNLGLIPDLVSQNPLCGTDQTVRDTSPDCLGNFYASSRDGSWATWFDKGNSSLPMTKA